MLFIDFKFVIPDDAINYFETTGFKTQKMFKTLFRPTFIKSTLRDVIFCIRCAIMFLTKAVPLPDFSASSMFSESNIKEDNRMPYHFFSKAKAFCCIIENCYNILNAFGVGCGNHLGHFDMVERKLFRLIPVVIVQCHVSPRPFQRPIERSRSFVHQPMQGDARPYGQPSHSLTAADGFCAEI